MLRGYILVNPETLSEEVQRRQIDGWLSHRHLGDIHITVESGVVDQPRLQECLNQCQAGDLLVVASLRYLGWGTRRVLLVVDHLNAHNVSLVALAEQVNTDRSPGAMAVATLGAVNQFDRALISERTKAAFRALRHARRYTGGARPFGWDVRADGSLTPNANDRKILDRVLELHDNGLGYRKIANTLMQEGFAPPRGYKFHPEQVRRMVVLGLDSPTLASAPPLGTSALRAERERLLIRLAEIDALLASPLPTN